MLKLVALGLDLDEDYFRNFTNNSWGHSRILRFPNNKAENAYGIHSHTDYGLVVIASQDDVGGLYVRPPVAGEKRGRNWL
jgi:isopenicillin N synthase-like dioxygenase